MSFISEKEFIKKEKLEKEKFDVLLDDNYKESKNSNEKHRDFRKLIKVLREKNKEFHNRNLFKKKRSIRYSYIQNKYINNNDLENKEQNIKILSHLKNNIEEINKNISNYESENCLKSEFIKEKNLNDNFLSPKKIITEKVLSLYNMDTLKNFIKNVNDKSNKKDISSRESKNDKDDKLNIFYSSTERNNINTNKELETTKFTPRF